MPRFSLVVGTKGRPNELAALLSSLESQNRRDMEIFVVDQNDDDRVLPALKSFQYPDIVRRLRPRPGARPGVSSARNEALPLCTGEILAFPDDDCWYPEKLLDSVDQWFQSHPEAGIFTITSRDRKGNLSANQWKADLCDLNSLNIFRTTATSTIFIRRSHCPADAFFDEDLGPGSSTGLHSSDDTDFVLMLMSRGLSGKFTQQLYVGHPNRHEMPPEAAKRRAISYGLGMGCVLRKYRLVSLWLFMTFFDLVRAGVNFVRGDAGEASIRWRHGVGVIRGFLSGPRVQRANKRLYSSVLDYPPTVGS